MSIARRVVDDWDTESVYLSCAAQPSGNAPLVMLVLAVMFRGVVLELAEARGVDASDVVDDCALDLVEAELELLADDEE